MTERATANSLQVGDRVTIPHGIEHTVTSVSSVDGRTRITYDTGVIDTLPDNFEVPRVKRR